MGLKYIFKVDLCLEEKDLCDHSKSQWLMFHSVQCPSLRMEEDYWKEFNPHARELMLLFICWDYKVMALGKGNTSWLGQWQFADSVWYCIRIGVGSIFYLEVRIHDLAK